jgi:hypothetical protein
MVNLENFEKLFKIDFTNFKEKLLLDIEGANFEKFDFENKIVKANDYQDFTFNISRKFIKEFSRPIRKLLNYKKIVKIEISINCRNPEYYKNSPTPEIKSVNDSKIKYVYIELEKPKDSNNDYTKRIKIYHNSVFTSHKVVNTTTAGNLEYFIFHKKESKNVELNKLSKKLYELINKIYNDTFDRKTYQEKQIQKYRKRI